MNRHAKVIQQRKIAHLEARLARLEREAGALDTFITISKNIGKAVINIPKNIYLKIIDAFKDAYSFSRFNFSKSREVQLDAAAMALSGRIHRARMGVMGVSSVGYLKMVKFDEKNPIKSLFTGDLLGTKKSTLGDAMYLYGAEEQKKIKAAFQSWYSDYKSIFSAKVDQSGFKKFLAFLKRSFKFLYRLITALLPFFTLGTLLTAPWAFLLHELALYFLRNSGIGIMYNEDVMYAVRGVQEPIYLTNTKEDVIAIFKDELGLGGIILPALTLLEKAFYKWGVSTKMFDEMEAQSKTASYHRRVASTSYPRTASVINYLEAQAV
jgi:hypothetical protein